MLELTALAVSAVTQTCRQRALLPDDAVEVTWRHYAYDPDAIWFLDVEVSSTGTLRQRARALTI